MEKPIEEFSWYPGYSWTVICCPRCGIHLGWYVGSRLIRKSPYSTEISQYNSTCPYPAFNISYINILTRLFKVIFSSVDNNVATKFIGLIYDQVISENCKLRRYRLYVVWSEIILSNSIIAWLILYLFYSI